jgi:hypothetical protein
MSLGTLVIGINGQTQLLIDLTVLVAFALVIFVIAFMLGFSCGWMMRRQR